MVSHVTAIILLFTIRENLKTLLDTYQNQNRKIVYYIIYLFLLPTKGASVVDRRRRSVGSAVAVDTHLRRADLQGRVPTSVGIESILCNGK